MSSEKKQILLLKRSDFKSLFLFIKVIVAAGKGNYLLKLLRPYDTARKIDHSLLIHIIKVFKQWPIDFEKVSPSLLSAAQLRLTGLYTSH